MKYFTFAWLLLLGCSLQGQKMTVDVSQPWTLPHQRSWHFTGPLVALGKYFYATETKLTGGGGHFIIRIDQLDRHMKERGTRDISDSSHIIVYAPRTIAFAGKIWVFYYRMPNNKRLELCYSVLDPETLVATPGKVALSVNERKRIHLIISGASTVDQRLRIGFSPDSSKLLLALWGIGENVVTALLNKDGPIGQPRISHFDGEGKIPALWEAQVDNSGNGYFPYASGDYDSWGYASIFRRNLSWESGVLVQTEGGQDRWIRIDPVKEGQVFGVPHLHWAADGKTMYVYCPYTAPGFDHGVFLTTLDLQSLTLGTPQIFACPPDTTRKLQEMGYLKKKYSIGAADRAQYVFNELADGTIALTGYLVNAVIKTGSNSDGYYSYTEYDAGPILNFLIRGGSAKVAVIYRDQEESGQSGFIIVPSGNELICIYSDYADNIRTDLPMQYDAKAWISNPVLACAVITNAGKVIGRQKIANTDGSLKFYISERQKEGDNTFLVPLHGSWGATWQRKNWEIRWVELRVKS